MTASELERMAGNRMLYSKEYSKEWCFWRGVHVAAEVLKSPRTADEEWLDDLARIIKENKEEK